MVLARGSCGAEAAGGAKAVTEILDHKQSDAASYDEVAPAFDALTERYAAPVADRMLSLASLRPRDHVLDAGTGTGLVALRAARLVPEGKVIGIDHSAGMLETANRKAADRRIAATFRQMDAEALQFADATFDAVLSLFMLYHLPNPLAALQEFHRVLRPGGRIVLGVGRGPDLFSRAGLIQAGRRIEQAVATMRGRLLLAPDLLRRLLAERGIVSASEPVTRPGDLDIPKLLRAAGFTAVKTHWHGLRVALAPEAFWMVHAIYGSRERTLLASLPADQAAEVKTAFFHECQRVQSRGGSLVYKYGAQFYLATR